MIINGIKIPSYTSLSNNFKPEPAPNDDMDFVSRPSKADSRTKRIERCFNKIWEGYTDTAKHTISQHTQTHLLKMAAKHAKEFGLSANTIIKILNPVSLKK